MVSIYYGSGQQTEQKQLRLEESDVDETIACPECGCREYINKNLLGDGYRECKGCHQEWWTDIDYAEVTE